MTTMTEHAAARANAHLPPGPPLPAAMQALPILLASRPTMRRLARRYGSAFTLKLPLLGTTVVVSDPAQVKQLLVSGEDVVNGSPILIGGLFGPRSLFALHGDEHRRERKMLAPPLHGKKMLTYEAVFEEETLRETADWSEDNEFPSLPTMRRITLNAILRTVFGADGGSSMPFAISSRSPSITRRRSSHFRCHARTLGHGAPGVASTPTAASTTRSSRR